MNRMEAERHSKGLCCTNEPQEPAGKLEPQCSETFNSHRDLVKHIHETEKVFANCMEAERHSKGLCCTEEPQEPAAELEPQRDVMVHSCSDCNETFNSYSDLVKHIRETEKDFANPKKPKKRKKVYPCTECDQIYPCQRDLNDHMVIHTGANTCTVCNKTFSDRYYMKRHMRSHATGS